MALAAPAAAWAHGEAHEHAVAPESHRSTAGEHHHVSAISGHIERGDQDADHAHPALGAAVTVKSATPNVLPPARPSLPLVTCSRVAPPEPALALELGAHLAHPPPPRLRGPPTRVLLG